MSASKNISAEQIIDALKHSTSPAEAARKLGVSRQNLDGRARTNPEIKAIMADFSFTFASKVSTFKCPRCKGNKSPHNTYCMLCSNIMGTSENFPSLDYIIGFVSEASFVKFDLARGKIKGTTLTHFRRMTKALCERGLEIDRDLITRCQNLLTARSNAKNLGRPGKVYKTSQEIINSLHQSDSISDAARKLQLSYGSIGARAKRDPKIRDAYDALLNRKK